MSYMINYQKKAGLLITLSFFFDNYRL